MIIAMSLHTFGRLPPEVRRVFRAYEAASNALVPVSAAVRTHLRKTSAHNEQFGRTKLARGKGPVFSRLDFAPVVGDLVAPMFAQPLQIDARIDAQASVVDDLAVLERNHAPRHLTDHQARLVAGLAAYYTPGGAELPAAQRSLAWFRRLLDLTPYIFFFRQRQRLMAPHSLAEENLPYEEFRERVERARAPYAGAEMDKRVRNYHLTNLLQTDLFAMAVEEAAADARREAEGESALPEAKGSDANSDRTGGISTSEGDRGNGKGEATGDSRAESDVEAARTSESAATGTAGAGTTGTGITTGTTGSSTTGSSTTGTEPGTGTTEITGTAPASADALAVAGDKLCRLLRTLQAPRLTDLDLYYSDLYMLTIEAPVVHDNHSALLDAIAQPSELELCAVRLATPAELPATSHSDDYSLLLEWAEKQRSKTQSGATQVLERLGQWGFVHVHESAGTALYLFR